MCYSWWVLTSLIMIDRVHWIDKDKLSKFILNCQVWDMFFYWSVQYSALYHTWIWVSKVSVPLAARLYLVIIYLHPLTWDANQQKKKKTCYSAAACYHTCWPWYWHAPVPAGMLICTLYYIAAITYNIYYYHVITGLGKWWNFR